MLLARQGYRVLLVDRATFPSDTVSTHVVHTGAVAALHRWGLLERLVATGCPPIHTYTFDFGPFTIAGSPAIPGSPVSYCPRRTVLDALLVDAAVAAGVELRAGFSVQEVLVEDGVVVGIRGHDKGGPTVTERARLVIGADGRNSTVAAAVDTERYHEKPPLLAGYYAYWSDLPTDGRMETYIRPECGFGAAPTHDGLTMVVGGWAYAEFEAKKHDVEGNYLKLFDSVPDFCERIRSAKRETRVVGAAVPNYFRKPFGPGFVLVGDAAYNKDFITAQGIQDAFRDAELCATAVDQSLSGALEFDVAMATYQATRDEQVLPTYEFTTMLATMEPPPPEMEQLLGAVHGNQDAMDAFVRVNAGVQSPAEFFAPDNVGRIMAAAGGVPAPA
jgi:2-polyprenyl-6-methoxyphenol hydroxylase-like FAD-dependent oxidoreductase